jgi:O-antigen/teichoic acid export membrane protein
MGATLLLGIVLARSLGPSQLGVYGICISLAMILSVAARLGFPALATRELAVAVHRQEWALAKGVIHWFGRTIFLLSLLASVGLLLGVLIWTGFNSIWAGYAAWSAALIPFLALGALVGAELRGLDRLVAGQSLDSFVRPALTCLFCVGAVLFLGSMTAALALGLNVIASALTLALGLLLLRLWMPSPLRSADPERHGRRWGKSALMLGAVDGLRQVDANLGLIILGALSQVPEAGYLRVALSAIVFITLPQTVVHLVTGPTLARLGSTDEHPQLQELLSQSAASLFLVTMAFLIILIVAGQPLIELMFGAAYRPAWLPLVALAAAQLVNACFGVGWILMAMSGGERQLAQFYAVSVGLSILAGVPLCIAHGATGAAAAAILGALVQNLLVWRHVRMHHSVDCSVLSAWKKSKSIR